MKAELYQEVALTRNIPEARLHAGDVAVVVSYVPHPGSAEEGAVLEIFNAVGDSISVVPVPVSAIAPLRPDQAPAVRPLSPVG